MAAVRRLAGLACAVAMVASGCSYAEREPGLFPTRVPTTSEAPPPRAKFLPKPTNPRLPVLGEAIWVSGGRLPVTFRFAVHAVRRFEGAAVLDWYAATHPGEPVALCTQIANTRALRLATKLGFHEVERFEAYGAAQWLGVRPSATPSP